ncbi:MAG: dihydropteroate synthase, partial [Bacteroidales bacterium]|nr:dihydropteroate synthase [Bacteroidales bacterium]
EEEWARLEPALVEIAGSTPPGACPPPDKYRGRGPKLVRSTCAWEGPEGAKRPESPGGVLPVISIDTYRPEIVRRAYGIIGPFIVNDVGGGEPQMLRTVGQLGLPYVAMHGREPKGDVIEDVLDFFRDFAAKAEDEGIREWILDPGFGFGKTIPQNYEILRRLEELQAAGRDVLVGISRKSMIYKVLGTTPEEVMPETLALEMIALQKGATWLRVHDVPETSALVKVYSTMYTSSPGAAK